MLADDVLGESGTLLGGRPGTERLADGHHVVVDGLGQSDHGQGVVVPGQERRQIGCGGVGVVTADGVQDGDPVGGEPVGGGLQRVNALGDQAPLHQIGRIGQLHPGVADRRAAELVQQARPGPHLRRDGKRVALQQPLVAVAVRDDLDLRLQLRCSARSDRRSPRTDTGRTPRP